MTLLPRLAQRKRSDSFSLSFTSHPKGAEMSKRNLGIAMIVVGVMLIMVSLLADAIGVGAQPSIIGWKQILGAVIGAAVGIGGVVLVVRK
jgi:hypothetical protein